MLILVLVVFALMFGIGYYCSRSLFAPYTLMSGTWLCILVLYCVMDHGLFPLQNKFLLAILLWGGGFFFSSLLVEAFTGSLICDNLFSKKKKLEPDKKILNIYFVLVVICIPIIICISLYNAFIVDPTNMFMYLRMVNTGLDDTLEAPSFGVLNYIQGMAFVLYLIKLISGSKNSRSQIYILLILNILLAVVTMAKTSFFCLMISSVLILYYKRIITIKVISLFLIGFLIFSLLFQSLRHNEANELVDSNSFFSLYLLAGSTAFDNLDAIPGNTYWGWHTFRLYYAIQSFLGGEFPVAPTILDYISVPQLTNVYTVMYPFYVDFGYCGILVFACIMGSGYGFLYKKVRTGSFFYLLLYSIFAAYIMLEFIGEFILTNASLSIQYVVYSLLPYVLHFKTKKKYD